MFAALGWASVGNAINIEDIQPCEPLDPRQEYHDFNDSTWSQLLGTVTHHHFPPSVENLQAGFTAPLPRDIAFVLRQFPNHYRALNSMGRWALQNKNALDTSGEVWTADCYFVRALEFVPEDPVVPFVYGIYLHKAKRLEEAAVQYAAAERLGEQSADFYYNRGLLEIDRGNLDKAQEYADKAYAMHHPLPGLRDKLARAKAAAARKRTTKAQPAPPKSAQANRTTP